MSQNLNPKENIPSYDKLFGRNCWIPAHIIQKGVELTGKWKSYIYTNVFDQVKIFGTAKINLPYYITQYIEGGGTYLDNIKIVLAYDKNSSYSPEKTKEILCETNVNKYSSTDSTYNLTIRQRNLDDPHYFIFNMIFDISDNKIQNVKMNYSCLNPNDLGHFEFDPSN